MLTRAALPGLILDRFWLILVDFWLIFGRFGCRNGSRKGFGDTRGAVCFSMAFSMRGSIDVARFSFELFFREHRWDTVFYRVKRDVAMFADRRFDETFERNPLPIRR